MTTHWILRVGNGDNFIRSSSHRIWGINARTCPDRKHFIRNVQPGDKLWFVTSKSGGRVLAVATYRSHNTRDFGPLVATSMSNDELGWTGSGTQWKDCDIEIHYTDLYGLFDCELLTHIQSPSTIRKYNPNKCPINLSIEYSNIERYKHMTFEL